MVEAVFVEERARDRQTHPVDGAAVFALAAFGLPQLAEGQRAAALAADVLLDARIHRVQVVGHGASAFAAAAGRYPQYTLFVEGDRVVAESAESPRHRYGAFCELDHALSDTASDDRVRQWLSSGEAYGLYMSMNVCRYSC